MAVPSAGSGTASLAKALERFEALTWAIKQRSQGMINASNAGNVDGAAIVNYLRDIIVQKTAIATLVTTPGLTTYAQAQYNSPGFDIATEYNTMLTALTNVINWIGTNFPKDGTGYLLYEQIDGNGNVTYRQFTPAQLATFRTQLANLTVTIA